MVEPEIQDDGTVVILCWLETAIVRLREVRDWKVWFYAAEKDHFSVLEAIASHVDLSPNAIRLLNGDLSTAIDAEHSLAFDEVKTVANKFIVSKLDASQLRVVSNASVMGVNDKQFSLIQESQGLVRVAL